MHFVSDKSLQRPGYVYDDHGVGYPAGMKPEVVWNHIDGPLLYLSNGQLHWLTLWERLLIHLNFETFESVDQRRTAKHRAF